ncbi:MAG: hypothetical protein FWC15_06405 [Fibromonadales bacterium]|nr:hypothetical protein [Fibromonadales bacterium]
MLRFLSLLAVFAFMSCASSKTVNRDPEKINEKMIDFVNQAKAGFWKEAMEHITPEERAEMMDGNQVYQEYKDAVNRIRLTTIKNMDLGVDNKGRLVGVLAVLEESNNMFRAAEEKIAVDPSKLEDLSVKRQKAEEEAKKRNLESPQEPEKSEWDKYLIPTDETKN